MPVRRPRRLFRIDVFAFLEAITQLHHLWRQAVAHQEQREGFRGQGERGLERLWKDRVDGKKRVGG